MRKKSQFVQRHKVTVIEMLEEVYPETGRPLVRPKVHFVRAALLACLTVLCVGLASWGCVELLKYWQVEIPIPYGGQFALLLVLGLLLSLLLWAKHIVIFVIRVYQRYGPYSIRSKCLFVPNCSEYMILAIQKYGLIKGIKKGRNRYNRCHAPNGGIDYP